MSLSGNNLTPNIDFPLFLEMFQSHHPPSLPFPHPLPFRGYIISIPSADWRTFLISVKSDLSHFLPYCIIKNLLIHQIMPYGGYKTKFECWKFSKMHKCNKLNLNHDGGWFCNFFLYKFLFLFYAKISIRTNSRTSLFNL